MSNFSYNMADYKGVGPAIGQKKSKAIFTMSYAEKAEA